MDDLWGFNVTLFPLYFCRCSLRATGGSFFSISCHHSLSTGDKIRQCIFLKATACHRLITTKRIKLFRSVKRQRDVCWYALVQNCIFTSSVTITAWAWGYCHAVAMTSGIHKKILACLVQKGEACWQKHTYVIPVHKRRTVKDTHVHTCILSA